MHWTLCEIAQKRRVFILTTVKVPLYLLVTFDEFISPKFELECLK